MFSVMQTAHNFRLVTFFYCRFHAGGLLLTDDLRIVLLAPSTTPLVRRALVASIQEIADIATNPLDGAVDIVR